MKRLTAVGVLITLVTCRYDPAAKIPVQYADALTEKYAAEQLRAQAAGEDCRVLLVRAKAPLDDSAVERIHYGTGEPGIHADGIQRLLDERKFRAVAYTDINEHLWTYGAITRDEAAAMETCR